MILSGLLVMAGVLSVAAQDAMSVIRKHYAEAKQKVEQYEKTEEEEGYTFPLYYEVNIQQNLPGTGPHRENVRMYYWEEDNEDWQPDEPMLFRGLQFVTYKYNFAAREFYEEYLYDKKGNIEFVYCRSADMDEYGGEYRLYFKNGELFRVLVSTYNLETEKYEQTYTGTKMPEKYSREYKSCIYYIKQFKNWFDELDSHTFH